jgi:hypothetical protein
VAFRRRDIPGRRHERFQRIHEFEVARVRRAPLGLASPTQDVVHDQRCPRRLPLEHPPRLVHRDPAVGGHALGALLDGERFGFSAVGGQGVLVEGGPVAPGVVEDLLLEGAVGLAREDVVDGLRGVRGTLAGEFDTELVESPVGRRLGRARFGPRQRCAHRTERFA